MNFKVNLFFHLYETHITPLGIPILTVPRVSDKFDEKHKNNKKNQFLKKFYIRKSFFLFPLPP